MKNQEAYNPGRHNFLTAGGFSVRLGPDHPFSKISIDQKIEETVNNDTQTARGTIGLSMKAGTIGRCYLTAEYIRAFLR